MSWGCRTRIRRSAPALLAVAVNAFANLVPHAREQHVRWHPALIFAAAGLAGAFVGSSIGKAVDGRRLLILFALLMLFIAAMMLRGRKADSGPVSAERPHQSLAARSDRARGWLACRVLRDRWRVPRGARTDPRDWHADDRGDWVRAGRGRRFRHHDGGRTMPSPDSLIGRSRCCSSPAGSAADGSARIWRNGFRHSARR